MAASSGKELFVPRINQLDAVALDKEVESLLKSQLSSCFNYLQHSSLLKTEPEIIALGKFIIWRFSVISKGATIGQQLLDLKYGKEKTGEPISITKSLALGIFLIGSPWLKHRIADNSLFSNSLTREILNIILELVETLSNIASLINFLVFLRNGNFVSLHDRMFGIRSVPVSAPVLREVQYEYMNRELLWHGFAEFLSFILPLMNLQRMKNMLKRFVTSSTTPSSVEKRTLEDTKTCGICQQWPTFPHDIGCQHVFCYYCIMSNVMADPQYQCPLCSFTTENLAVKPVSILAKIA